MAAMEQPMTGQAVYSPAVLRVYDWYVLGFSNHLIWRCPTAELRALYDRNVSDRHLDIGVGTGYFLDRARWPVANPSITLVDLNPNSLAAASSRIRRFAPHAVAANALEPLPVTGRYRSASLCYLLHCLPGAIPRKALVFDHVRSFLEPGARVFGATILQGGVSHSRTALALMNLYNSKGIFSNANDSLEDLNAELTARFAHVKVEVQGTVALFEAVAA